MMKRWLGAWCGVVAWGLLASTLQADDRDDAGPRIRLRQIVQKGEGREAGEKGERAPQDWIGIALLQLSDTIKSQLRLTAGLVVTEVMEDSPAQRAGLELHDILVRLNKQEITDHASVLKAVADAQRKECEVEVIRQGQPLQLKITPVARPAKFDDRIAEDFHVDWDRGPAVPEPFREWLKRAMRGEDKGRMLFIRPGIAGKLLTRDLKGEWKLHLKRSGDGPPNLRLEHDGKTWDVTPDQLDQLPEDAREVARRIFEGNPTDFQFDQLRFTQPPAPPANLDDIRAELRELRDAVKKLQDRE